MFGLKGKYGATVRGRNIYIQHSYCIICTSRYIIEQEEHKCPQCRCEFHGDPGSIEKVVYEVIEEDKILY